MGALVRTRTGLETNNCYPNTIAVYPAELAPKVYRAATLHATVSFTAPGFCRPMTFKHQTVELQVMGQVND